MPTIAAPDTPDTVDGRIRKRVIDILCPHIQRAAENAGETENIVDLIGIIASSGTGEFSSGGDRHIGENFRSGVRHGKDDGIAVHGSDHIGGNAVGSGKSEENICTFDRFGESAEGGVFGEHLLLFTQIGTTGVKHTIDVAEDHIFQLCSGGEIKFTARQSGGTGTVDYEAALLDFFTDRLETIQNGGK